MASWFVYPYFIITLAWIFFYRSAAGHEGSWGGAGMADLAQRAGGEPSP